MLYLYRRVIFGALTKEDLKTMMDLNRREIAVFAPLVAATLWMGIWPEPFLDVIHASVANLIQNYEVALKASDALTVAGR